MTVRGEIKPPSELILSERLKILPLVCQKGVQDVIPRAQRMKENQDRLKFRAVEEFSPTIPQVQEISQEYIEALEPFKGEVYSWSESWFRAWSMVKDTCRFAGGLDRYKLFLDVQAAVESLVDFRTIHRLGYEIGGDGNAGLAVWRALLNTRNAAAAAAALETIKDQPNFKKNFCLPLLSLYEHGAVEANFYYINGEEKLVVDFPLKLKEGSVLGCWAFGDPEILYYHELEETCPKVKPIEPLTQKRVIQPVPLVHLQI